MNKVLIIYNLYSNNFYLYVQSLISIYTMLLYLILSIFFQALNGFLMILTCEGEVFFATHSIEGYLGFHQVKNNLHKTNSRSFKKMLCL